MGAANVPYARPPADTVSDSRRWLVVGLAVMFVLIGVGMLLALLGDGRMMSGDWGPWMMGSWSIYGWLLMFFMLMVILLAVFWIVRAAVWASPGRVDAPPILPMQGVPGSDPAVAIARERFARGEITRDQFDQIVGDLARSSPPHAP